MIVLPFAPFHHNKIIQLWTKQLRLFSLGFITAEDKISFTFYSEFGHSSVIRLATFYCC